MTNFDKAPALLATLALSLNLASGAVYAEQPASSANAPKDAQVASNEQAADVNLNDGKLTSEEKKIGKAKAAQSDKYVEEQAKQVNSKIPGAKVDPHDLKETEVKKGGGFPNPLGWLFKPLTKLQEQSVRLEQDMIKLTGPISVLQPTMLKLDGRMTSVEGDMNTMRDQIGDVKNQMGSMQKDIRGMRTDLLSIKQPISDLRAPIMSLRDPVLKLAAPVEGVEKRLNNLDKQLNDLKTLLGLVLTAIFLAAGLIAVGTPLAAIWVWRNRNKFLKPNAGDAHADKQLENATKTAGKQVDADDRATAAASANSSNGNGVPKTPTRV